MSQTEEKDDFFQSQPIFNLKEFTIRILEFIELEMIQNPLLDSIDLKPISFPPQTIDKRIYYFILTFRLIGTIPELWIILQEEYLKLEKEKNNKNSLRYKSIPFLFENILYLLWRDIKEENENVFFEMTSWFRETFAKTSWNPFLEDIRLNEKMQLENKAVVYLPKTQFTTEDLTTKLENLGNSEKKEEEKEEKSNRSSTGTGSSISKDMDERSFEFLHWDPRDIAEQLTIIHGIMVWHIKLKELLNQSWQSDEKLTLSPNVIRVCNYFNHISHWTSAIVVRSHHCSWLKPSEVIIHFIQICVELRKLNNFHSLLAVLSGLNHSTVIKFQNAWRIGDSWKQQLDALNLEMDPSHNFRAYRQSFLQTKEHKLPCMNLILADITFINTGNQGEIENALCWNRCSLLGNQFCIFLQSQQDAIAFALLHRNSELLHFFWFLPPTDMDVIHRLSLSIREAERKNTLKHSSSETNINEIASYLSLEPLQNFWSSRKSATISKKTLPAETLPNSSSNQKDSSDDFESNSTKKTHKRSFSLFSNK